MSWLCPRQCITTYGTAALATSRGIAGSASPPLTSLTSRDPAVIAAAATSARMVSTLTHTPSAASASMTGIPRRRSSGSETRCAPGRVDSPPTSTMSAPAATSSRPCRIAASVSNQTPPSEKESGVTLTTPMTRQRPGLGSPGTAGMARVVTLASLCARVSAAQGGRHSRGLTNNGLRLLAAENEAHRLGPGLRVIPEVAADRGRDGFRPRLSYAAPRHAQVLGLDHDDDAARLEGRHQRVGDLAGHPLLHLRPPGVDVHQPGELGQPGDMPLFVGRVPHMRHAVERHQVMLTDRVDLDVLDQDHLVVIGVEHGVQDVRGPLSHPGELFGVRARHPGRGVDESVAIGVLPD